MADVSDVGQALVNTIAALAYPNGTAAPSIVPGSDIKVYQGWPVPAQLTADLAIQPPANTVIHITVFPRPGDKVTSVMMGDTEWLEQSNNGTTGVSIREIRRQTRTFQITIWANCFDHRDPVAGAIDAALAATTRFTLPDGSQAIMTYVNSAQDDSEQKQGIYRRDLFYAVNYATTQTEADYTVLHVQTNVSSGPTLTAQGPVITVIAP